MFASYKRAKARSLACPTAQQQHSTRPVEARAHRPPVPRWRYRNRWATWSHRQQLRAPRSAARALSGFGVSCNCELRTALPLAAFGRTLAAFGRHAGAFGAARIAPY